MTKILFVCHGNICRSPAAEFVLKDMLCRAGLKDEFQVESAATSTEEIGNPVYPPMRRVLSAHGLDCTGKTARQIRRSDYESFDLLIGMDEENLWNMRRIFHGDPEGKLHNLLEYAGRPHDAIADPSDIPQIRQYMNYYLPTTIKLLNAYDRMGSAGVQGENIDKSMKNINEMLDAAIEAYKKRLDSLFENQALDIETDIEVMNTMLAREGLAGNKDFDI